MKMRTKVGEKRRGKVLGKRRKRQKEIGVREDRSEMRVKRQGRREIKRWRNDGTR